MDEGGRSQVVVDEGGQCTQRPYGHGQEEKLRAVHEVYGNDLAREDCVVRMQVSCIAKDRVVCLFEGPLSPLVDKKGLVRDFWILSMAFHEVEGIGAIRLFALLKGTFGGDERNDEAQVDGDSPASIEICQSR